MMSFGTLGIGLGVGTVAEYTRRTFGLKKQSLGNTFDTLFLTKANAERIVSTLCKVRGKYSEYLYCIFCQLMIIYFTYIYICNRCCFKNWTNFKYTR